MIISIDLDNVIRDQIGSIIEAAYIRYGVRLTRSAFHAWDPPIGELIGVPNEEFTAWAWPILTQPWLERWKIPYSAIVHTGDKGVVAFDLHIDDSPKTLLALSEAGRQVVRFELPWNGHLAGLPTMAGWWEELPVFSVKEGV